MDLQALITSYGLPTGMLIAFCLAAWRVAIWMAANVIQPITNSHLELVESAKKTNELNAQTLEKLTSIEEKKAEQIDNITRLGTKSIEMHTVSQNLIQQIKCRAQEIK